MATSYEIENKIDEAFSILEKDSSAIPDRIYKALEGVSSIFLAWKRSGGKSGWSESLVDLSGSPLFTKEQSVNLEEGAKILEPFTVNQRGGVNFAHGSSGSNSIVKVPLSIKPEDISLDKLYHTVTTTLDRYDEQWRDITKSLGIVEAIETTDKKGVIVLPFIPPIPVPFYIFGKTILPFLNAVLELLRIAVSNTIIDFPTGRILLSVMVAFLDLLRGEWKNGVLSLLGVINSTGTIVGFFGKIVRNAWLLVSPDLQIELRDDLFKSGKSMLIGFLIWSFSIFSPDVLRFTIDASFQKIRDLVSEFNKKSDEFQKKAEEIASTMPGVKITFPHLPFDMVPSMDDIQNLQVLARIPEIYCSDEFQKLLAPILIVPPLRIVIELLNIPTLPEDIEKMCPIGVKPKLAESILEAIEPKITLPTPENLIKDTILKNKKGGGKQSKTRKNKNKKKSKPS